MRLLVTHRSDRRHHKASDVANDPGGHNPSSKRLLIFSACSTTVALDDLQDFEPGGAARLPVLV
jgi:hypothetical protein